MSSCLAGRFSIVVGEGSWLDLHMLRMGNRPAFFVSGRQALNLTSVISSKTGRRLVRVIANSHRGRHAPVRLFQQSFIFSRNPVHPVCFAIFPQTVHGKSENPISTILPYISPKERNATMNCPKCNSPLAADATSCPVCNTPVRPMSQASESASQQTFQQASPAHQNEQQQPGAIPPKEKVQAKSCCPTVKKYGLLGVIGLFVLIVCLCLFAGNDGKKEYEKGKEASYLQANKTAAHYYKKAAKKGNTDAMIELGRCYEHGWGVPKDKYEAVEWVRKAAEKGNAQAMSHLGYYYKEGDLVPQNIDESRKWYRCAVEVWQKAAEKGDANAMQRLGVYYWEEEDREEARKWYRAAANTLEKAAEKGDTDAMHELSVLYGITYGEKAKSFNWCRKAAEKGNVDAMREIALEYSLGIGHMGLTKDEREAYKWNRKAAEKGDASAMFFIGLAYAEGEVVEENQKEAIKWYRKAAKKGDVGAMYHMGLQYENGEGVDLNTKEAIKWYRKAAEEGDVSGKGRLEKLAQQGYEEAQKALDSLAAD